MFDPISATIAVYLVPIFINFFIGLLNYKHSKKKLRSAIKVQNEMRAELAKEREIKKAQELDAKQAKEREGRQALEEAVKQANERVAKLVKIKMAGEAKQEAAKQAKEKEAKQEEGVRVDQQAELVKELIEQIRLVGEKLDRETQERKEGEENQNKKINSLAHTIELGMRLFRDYMLRRQSSPCHCSIHPCRCQPQMLEYDERVKLLTHFELPKDGDEDLDKILNASYSSLQDKPNHSLDVTESSEEPNRERNPEDILNMVMAAVNDPEKSGDTTLLELNYQLFEDNQESSEMTPTNNGTQAKEEGNAFFKKQKFEEAIECYSRSIFELPTTAAYGNRAMAYIKLNKFIEAEKDCTEALKIDENYFKAYARRAIARSKHGCDLEGAIDDVRVALGLEPNNVEMEELSVELVSLKGAIEAKEEGNKFFKDQNFKAAIRSYSLSINKFPTAVVYSNRAVVYLKQEKWKEAENDCSEALKIDDQYFKAYARRAVARSKIKGNLKCAIGDVEVALKLEPDNQEMEELHAKLIQKLG